MPYDFLALLHFFLGASVTVFVVGSKLSAVASCATSPRNRCAFRHETCELALERLDCASAPARGEGLGRGVGKDVVFAFFQSIEDTLRSRLGRGLWYVEAAVHICIDGLFVILILSCAWASSPKVGAGCGNSARPDLWRGS